MLVSTYDTAETRRFREAAIAWAARGPSGSACRMARSAEPSTTISGAGVVVAEDLAGRSSVAHRQRGAGSADLEEHPCHFGQTSHEADAAQQPLPDGGSNGIREVLPGIVGQLAAQPVGFVTLDIDGPSIAGGERLLRGGPLASRRCCCITCASARPTRAALSAFCSPPARSAASSRRRRRFPRRWADVRPRSASPAPWRRRGLPNASAAPPRRSPWPSGLVMPAGRAHPHTSAPRTPFQHRLAATDLGAVSQRLLDVRDVASLGNRNPPSG